MDYTFFTHNRQAIFAKAEADVIILAGNVSLQRSNDASYIFEQEANFWYLTGITAPGWWLVIERHKSTLISPTINEVHRIFDGELSFEEAKAMSGVQEALSREAGEALLESLKGSVAHVATLGEDPHADHYDFMLNPGPVVMFEKLRKSFGKVEDCRRSLAELRAIKSPVEVQLMREAIALTIDAFKIVRKNSINYSFEYEIEAEFTYQFRKNGASGHAYDPIVASGKNACTLHYGKNQDPLITGDLVLIDVGARLHGYPADITRTYAIGKVSQRHKAVHAEVVKAHQQIMALLHPGLRVKDYFSQVDIIMQLALENLNLLKTKDDYRKYFPHSISHGLGIDVHDSLGGPDIFQPGMVVTVEPGIYIPEEDIGVRIEDDILITKTGYENLSGSLSTDL